MAATRYLVVSDIDHVIVLDSVNSNPISRYAQRDAVYKYLTTKGAVSRGEDLDLNLEETRSISIISDDFVSIGCRFFGPLQPHPNSICALSDLQSA